MPKNRKVRQVATCHPEKLAHAFGLCSKCYMADYRQRYPERVTDTNVRAKYGISLYRKEEMLVLQSGRCPICGGSGRLYVDHDHDTGVVRGLLCDKCNPGLGFFRNDPALLRAAAMYLENVNHAMVA